MEDPTLLASFQSFRQQQGQLPSGYDDNEDGESGEDGEGDDGKIGIPGGDGLNILTPMTAPDPTTLTHAQLVSLVRVLTCVGKGEPIRELSFQGSPLASASGNGRPSTRVLTCVGRGETPRELSPMAPASGDDHPSTQASSEGKKVEPHREPLASGGGQ